MLRRVLPLLLLLAFDWPGLTNWFYQDDFGWLNLRHDVHSVRDLGPALFAPKAHGNIRPLGENAYFLVLSSVFGVNPLPFRICAFLTQMGSLLLLGAIVERLTASRLAAFAAQVFWIASPSLAQAMCWTSIYNQILSGLFFLLAFYCFLREKRLAHWIAFVLGIGALETNVMYPAIAAVYALLYARERLKEIWPMFAVSAIAAGVHFHFAPPPAEGVYAPHLDWNVLPTLWTYWTWAFASSQWAVAVLSSAILSLLIWQVRRRRWFGLFGLAWFAIVLCPYLPLNAHRSDYYLAVPVIGLAMVGASAMAGAPRVAAVFAAIYLIVSIPKAWAITNWNHARGERVADLVLGVADVHRAQPDQIILLDGVDLDLFQAGIVDLPFRAMEIPHVYLAPEPSYPATKYVLPQALTLRALESGRAVVYRVDGPALRNITNQYRLAAEAGWKAELPWFINIGDPVFAEYLGPGWSECQDGYRLLPGAATVKTGGLGNRLYIGVFRTSTFHLGVRVDGTAATPRVVHRGGELTELVIDLSQTKPELEVRLENQEAEPLRFGYLEVRSAP